MALLNHILRSLRRLGGALPAATSARSELARGQAAFQAGDDTVAEQAFLAALKLGADDWDCRLHLARIYNRKSKWDLALEQWSWLSSRAPALVEPHLQVGRAHFRLGGYSEAKLAFDNVLSIAPGHPEAQQKLNEILRRWGATSQPQDVSAIAPFDKGRVAFRQEDFEVAETHFLNALRLGADEPGCRLYLARIYNIEQDWPKALEQWLWLRGNEPAKVEPQLQVARAQFRLGRLPAAAEGYRAVLDLAPNHDEARLSLHQIERIQHQLPSSENLLSGDSWLSLVPPELRWQVARDSVEVAVAALEALLGAIGREAGALHRQLRAYGNAPGKLLAHRQLYRIQAEARVDEIAQKVKGIKRTARWLSQRTAKIMRTFDEATHTSTVDGDALPQSLDPQWAPPAPWRRSPLETAVDIYRRSGFDAALLWLLKISPVDGRASMLIDFAAALREIDRAASMGALWLAYGVNPSPAAAVRVAGRMFQAGNLSQSSLLLQAAPAEAASPMVAEMRSTAFLYRNGIEVPTRVSRSVVRPTGRLAYVASSSLQFQVAGYTLRTHRLLEALTNRGTNVMCFVRPGYPWDRPRICPPGLARAHSAQKIGRITYVQTPLPDVNRAPEHLVEQMSDALEQHFRAYGCDVVQAASNSRNALPALIAARRVGAKFIYEVRGLWELTAASRTAGWEETERFAFDRKLEVMVASNADHVLAITTGVSRELIAGGMEPGRVSLLPNAVDPDEYQPRLKDGALMTALGLRDEDFVLVYVGSLTVYEGLQDLVVALSAMRRDGQPAKLVLAGAGEMEQSLRELVKREGMTDQVLFAGPITPDQTSQYLSLADAVALPRKRFKVCEVVPPLKPYEAMSMAKPVVVSDLAALTEIVVDGETGLVCQPDDPEDLARVLIKLRQDRLLGRRLGEAARAWVLRHATWEHAADIVLRTHGKLLAEASTAHNRAPTRLLGASDGS